VVAPLRREGDSAGVSVVSGVHAGSLVSGYAGFGADLGAGFGADLGSGGAGTRETGNERTRIRARAVKQDAKVVSIAGIGGEREPFGEGARERESESDGRF